MKKGEKAELGHFAVIKINLDSLSQDRNSNPRVSEYEAAMFTVMTWRCQMKNNICCD
jgi:hypothetical protein